MLACSILWALVPVGRPHSSFNNPVAALWLVWLPTAWLVFPAGAVLGWNLPRWVAGRSLAAAAGRAVLVGLISGLVLASGFWLCMNFQELIGLVVNRNSGGYESYSVSVGIQLREQAGRALMGVAPVTAIWVAAWTIWTQHSSRLSVLALADKKALPGVQLRFDRQLLRLLAWVVAGFAIFAIAVVLLSSLNARGFAGGQAIYLLVIGPVAAGMMILGPWLGPLLNPHGGFDVAWQWTAVALPVLLAGFAPFALCRRPVGVARAVEAWCGLVTALLFWTAAGAMSLGWSLG